MILIEIFSDNSELFKDVPREHHKKLIQLYSKGISEAKTKPQFVKISTINLIKYYFISKKFKNFDVKKLLDNFTKFYHKLEIHEKEIMKVGFLEDLEDVLFDYLTEIN